MSYKWWNNGWKNVKIYENNYPPEGYVKGYIITKDKRTRLKKLTERYEKRIQSVLDKHRRLAEKEVKNLENELIELQKKITNF